MLNNEIRQLRYNLHNTDLHFIVLYETVVGDDDMYSCDYDYMFMIKYRNSVYKLYINNNHDYNIVVIDDYGDCVSIFEYHDTNIDNIIKTVHNIILIDYNGMVIKQFINNNNIVIDNKIAYDFNIRTAVNKTVNKKVKYHFESDEVFSVINNYNDKIVDFHDLNSALEYLIKKCNFEF